MHNPNVFSFVSIPAYIVHTLTLFDGLLFVIIVHNNAAQDQLRKLINLIKIRALLSFVCVSVGRVACVSALLFGIENFKAEIIRTHHQFPFLPFILTFTHILSNTRSHSPVANCWCRRCSWVIWCSSICQLVVTHSTVFYLFVLYSFTLFRRLFHLTRHATVSVGCFAHRRKIDGLKFAAFVQHQLGPTKNGDFVKYWVFCW